MAEELTPEEREREEFEFLLMMGEQTASAVEPEPPSEPETPTYLEQESQQETAEVYSGWVKGLRDPVDALSQMLYQALPESVKESGDELNNWLAEKTGLLEPIPEGGFGEQLRQQEEQYQAGRAAEGDTGVDWDRLGGNVVSTAVPGLAAAKVAAPASLSGKVATGAGTGAGYGLLTPTQEEDFWGAKGKQALTGAAVGGTFRLLAHC